jgi:hypothetical protein
MLLRATLLTVAFAALTAAPAHAGPVLNPIKPCYVAATEDQRELVTIDGWNFTPFATVVVYVDDIDAQLNPPPQADFDGTLHGTVSAPYIDGLQRRFTVRVAEQANLNNNFAVSAMVTRLMVEQSPERASTKQKVRFRGRGFTELTKPVYAHYVFAGKARKTVRIGLPTGDCGLFSIKRKQFPFKNSPRVGLWTIQFDQEAKYDPKASPRVPLTIRVSRSVKRPRAQAR